MKTKEHHLFIPENYSIPLEIMLSKELEPTAKAVFYHVSGLDKTLGHCFDSNAYLAAFLNVTEKTISLAIKSLIENGYVEKVSFDGRKRVLRINPEWERQRADRERIIGENIDIRVRKIHIYEDDNEHLS